MTSEISPYQLVEVIGNIKKPLCVNIEGDGYNFPILLPAIATSLLNLVRVQSKGLDVLAMMSETCKTCYFAYHVHMTMQGVMDQSIN